MANTARVTQSALELITTQSGNVQITQNAIEFVTGAGISCGSPPAGFLGVAYTHTFLFGGGTPPYTFSISAGALPTGVTLNASTGVISGVPSALGTFTFTVTILDNMGTTQSVSCSITIGSAQSIIIQLLGWKLYPQDPCPDPEELMELPHVDRAV